MTTIRLAVGTLAAALIAVASIGPAHAQGSSSKPASGTSAAPRAANDSTRPPSATNGPASTQPSSSRTRDAAGNPPTGETPGSQAIPGGVPAMRGVTPNRAELAGSAFTKLDARNRGYLTPDDVRQLEGFDSAFRQSDQNGDGQLNPSEFNAAWGLYTGNVR